MYEKQVKAAVAALSLQDDSFFATTVDRTALDAAASKALAALGDDIARIRKDSGVLFAVSTRPDDSEASGQKLARLFEAWRDDPPSTVALICVAAEHFGIPEDNKALQAALMAGLAANVDHPNGYHSPSHFREVTAAMARLVAANNDLAAAGTPGTELLEDNDIAKSLLAAAAHDLMHDGKGNSPAGISSWKQYLLEDKAIAAAEPFMALAGMAEKDREDVRVMIRVTDITSKNHSLSPHKHLRQIFNETFRGVPRTQQEKAAAAPAGLDALSKDRALLVMAALLSDADVTPSAATDYTFGRRMTKVFSDEMPATIKDNDQTLAGFISFVTERQFTSTAGNYIGRGALTAIFEEASRRAALESAPTPPAAPKGPQPKAP